MRIPDFGRLTWQFYICLMTLTMCVGLTSGSEVELDHPLFRAIRARDDQALNRMLRQGTPVNLRSSDGTTPLMVATLHGNLTSVQILLDHGADPNMANQQGVTALLWGATELPKVQLLLAHGAEVNARSAGGNTPLLVAASSPDGAAVVQALLTQGADLIRRNQQGRSALQNAVRAGDLNSIQLLLAYAEEANKLEELIGAHSTNLIETAASTGDTGIVTLLCDQLTGIHGGKLPPTGQAVNLALLAEHIDVAELLIARGADITVRRNPGNVPTILLATYTETGNPLALKALLAHDIDLHARNRDEETALTWARRRGHPELIELLTNAGVPDHAEKTPEIPARQINLHAGNQQRLLADSVSKSIALLQHASDVFLEQRSTCVSCHHQNLPAVAIGWARDRGVATDQASVARMVRRQVEPAGGTAGMINRCYQLDNPVPVPPRLFGYGLWGLAALGYPSTRTSEAAVWYLAATQRPDGRWTSGTLRPPMGDGDFVATLLAMQALQLYPIPARADEFRERVRRAAAWLKETPARYHQERVYQLLGLGWSGQEAAELESLTQALLQQQRDDGGWSQLPNLKSDAWATGQALVALHVAGGVATSDPAYQRGIVFLLNSQFDDGSWFVKSRSWPFQPPFDSEFPHGRDQWVSAPATAWAVMAMTLAMQPADVSLPPTIDAAETTEPRTEAPRRPEADSPAASFSRDIKPLLERSCVGCHSGDEPQGNLDMTERILLLRGGETGTTALVPGSSEESLMFIAAAGVDEALIMPPRKEQAKFPPLSPTELDKLKQWIDSGAAWTKGVRLQRPSY